MLTRLNSVRPTEQRKQGPGPPVAAGLRGAAVVCVAGDMMTKLALPEEGVAVACARKRATVAILLLVPAPTVGVLAGMVLFPDSAPGAAVFTLSKVWVLGLPLFWRLCVERQPLSLSPVRHGGIAVGIGSGLLIGGAILGAWGLFGAALIERRTLVLGLERVGLTTPARFAVGALYWVTVNSVLEEFVWRWFCMTRAQCLLRPAAAVGAAALFFTVHHTIALQVYLDPVAVGVCSVGVFGGGAFWGWMYQRYGSVWPGVISHALVDLCIFGLGAVLLFGSAVT